MEQKNYFDGFDCWDNGVKESYRSSSVVSQFELTDVAEPDFIWAVYSCESYEGSAFVAFFNNADMKWKSVAASHCSCYGLEGQWDPEDFDPKLYFESLAKGKSTLSTWAMRDTTEFEEWLAWAVSHTI